MSVSRSMLKPKIRVERCNNQLMYIPVLEMSDDF